jgi:poly(A) polymerase
LIHDVPAARLFDEILKLLMSGYSWQAIQGLREAGLHHGVLPLLDAALDPKAGVPGSEAFIRLALNNTDERIQNGKGISAGFLFATLLWPELLSIWKKNLAAGMPNIAALHAAMDDVIATQSKGMMIQRRFEADMREIWSLQPRFDKRIGRFPQRMLELPRFRAGYDFMLLRCATGERAASLGQWWARFIDADPAQQEALLASVKEEASLTNLGAPPAKRRRRRKPKTTSLAAPDQAVTD